MGIPAALNVQNKHIVAAIREKAGNAACGVTQA